MPEAIPPEAFDPSRLPSGRVPVMFWADWCGFCRRFSPEFDARAADAGGEFFTVDISDEESPVWDAHAIQVVPTVILFEDGRPVDRIAGILRGDDLDRLLGSEA